MKTVMRMAILGMGSLLIGLLVNPFLNEGIPWRLLVPMEMNRTIKSRITFFDAKTAFTISGEKAALFIDIRPKAEFRLDHIPGAMNVPFVEFFRKPSRFLLPNKATLVIVYGFEFGSKKARILARYLARNGFMQTGMLYSGFSEWIQSGLPVEKGQVK